MTKILEIISGLVLLLFVAMWLWIAVRVLRFEPTPEAPALTFTTLQVTVAGFLASSVGAGTASILGIEIKKINDSQGDSLVGRVNTAAKASWLLSLGILLYMLVGGFVLMVSVFVEPAVPDMVSAFALGILGWLGGAFAAVFRL